MVTRAQHQQALDQQKADREANKQQKAYHEKYTSMTQKEVVESLVKAQPELNKRGGTVNIIEFLQNKGASSDPNVPILKFGAQSVRDVAIQKPIDVSQITDSSWMRPTKQTEARKTLADFGTIPSQIPTVQQETPTSRRMGFGQGGGAANLGLGYQTITEPTSFTDFAFGRINTPIQEPIVEEPEIIEETKTIQPDYTKIALIGVGVFAVLALIIVRIKK
tara:strand:+ start:95 stop:754 length:660 start_codon:yes stop_codon:yes gene_type:complete